MVPAVWVTHWESDLRRVFVIITYSALNKLDTLILSESTFFELPCIINEVEGLAMIIYADSGPADSRDSR